jgi:hypothetical protein
MATINAVNYAKAVNPTSDNVLSPGTLGGRVRVLTDNVTFAAHAAGTIVRLGRALQAGAIILGVELQFAALGAGVILSVGDSNDDDRYISLISGATADQTVNNVIGGRHYKIGTNSSDDVVMLKTSGAAATGLVKATIYYTED